MKDIDQVSKTLSDREQFAAVIWLVIGLTQLLTGALSIAGIWNIYAAYTRFKRSKAVLTPWSGIVDSYKNSLPRCILTIVINVILGGVYGILGALYEIFFVRGYVLKNKDVYKQAGY